MQQRLIIGNKLINLKEVDSTNTYMKQLVYSNDKEIEGMVVIAEHQFKGKGQRGNIWESEKGKNFTFSIFLTPNILVQNQFLISKVVSLGIIDFLDNLGLNELKIKWPNDIFCKKNKIAGILIENSIRNNKIENSILGIGLNVNQINFDCGNIPTSIIKELGCDLLNLEELLNNLLFFIEKRYLTLKSGKIELINKDYLNCLYGLNEVRIFKIGSENIDGTIIGVNSIGKLQVKIKDIIEEFDLKEIEFLS